MVPTEVNMAQLSDATYTRQRGEQAYARLGELMPRDIPVVVRIDQDSWYGTSFLDGFILGLAKDGLLSSVQFDVSDADMMAKLERISGARSLDIYCLSEGGRQLVQRRAPREFKFRRAYSKPKPPGRVSPLP